MCKGEKGEKLRFCCYPMDKKRKQFHNIKLKSKSLGLHYFKGGDKMNIYGHLWKEHACATATLPSQRDLMWEAYYSIQHTLWSLLSA